MRYGRAAQLAHKYSPEIDSSPQEKEAKPSSEEIHRLLVEAPSHGKSLIHIAHETFSIVNDELREFTSRPLALIDASKEREIVLLDPNSPLLNLHYETFEKQLTTRAQKLRRPLSPLEIAQFTDQFWGKAASYSQTQRAHRRRHHRLDW